MECAVCLGHDHVSEMTDGQTRHPVCDHCRSMVNMMFFIHRSLAMAVRQAAQALRGVTEASHEG